MKGYAEVALPYSDALDTLIDLNKNIMAYQKNWDNVVKRFTIEKKFLWVFSTESIDCAALTRHLEDSGYGTFFWTMPDYCGSGSVSLIPCSRVENLHSMIALYRASEGSPVLLDPHLSNLFNHIFNRE